MSQRDKARSFLAREGYSAMGTCGPRNKPAEGRNAMHHGPYDADGMDPATGLKRGGMVRGRPRLPKAPTVKAGKPPALPKAPPAAMDPDVLAANLPGPAGPVPAGPGPMPTGAGLASAAPPVVPPDQPPPYRRGGRVR
jgi:hypothetical protein